MGEISVRIQVTALLQMYCEFTLNALVIIVAGDSVKDISRHDKWLSRNEH